MLQALISPGYESEMTEIVGMWINTGLTEYNTKHNQNWKGKDSAISIRIFLVVNPVGCSEDIFSVPHISDTKHLHKLQACCSIPSKSARKAHTPSHFDTALIIQDHNHHKEKGGLHGMTLHSTWTGEC